MPKFLFALMMVIMMTNAAAQGTPRTPQPGTPERMAILDAARVPVEKELQQPVQFAVKRLNVLDGWAYLSANMQDPHGQMIDYASTPYAEEAKHGLKSDAYLALLRKQDGKWAVITYSIGPTDVAWAAWPGQYHTPEGLFGPIPDLTQ